MGMRNCFVIGDGVRQHFRLNPDRWIAALDLVSEQVPQRNTCDLTKNQGFAKGTLPCDFHLNPVGLTQADRTCD